MFALRHDHGGDLRDRELLDTVLAGAGADVAAVWNAIEGGAPLATIEKEHVAASETHEAWGVPTFVIGERAAFVRLLERPADAAEATATVERVLDTLEWALLNEFKHTSIPR